VRARQREPEFIPDAVADATIAELCERLDRLPLAIELAAARAASLGLDAVAAGLEDRFRILTEGRRTDLPRHRTLEAALDWSYGLLSQTDRDVASRLAVFGDRFSLEQAMVAASGGTDSRRAVLDGVASLVEKSLLSVDHRGAAPQYRFLETTRAYLAGKIACGGPGQPRC
jgi:predicted ATPase